MTDLLRRLLKSTAPDFVQDQVNLWLDMAEDGIRKDQDTKVAAWLRRIGKPQMADAIEAGEHTKGSGNA